MAALHRFIDHLNSVHTNIKFTNKTSSHHIPLFQTLIYVKEDHLHTRLYTTPSDRHMYLNDHSEHPSSLKKSIAYSLFLTLKKIHSGLLHLLEVNMHLYLYILRRDYQHELSAQAWKQPKEIPRSQLLSPKN